MNKKKLINLMNAKMLKAKTKDPNIKKEDAFWFYIYDFKKNEREFLKKYFKY